jgi:hypothetical protein
MSQEVSTPSSSVPCRRSSFGGVAGRQPHQFSDFANAAFDHLEGEDRQVMVDSFVEVIETIDEIKAIAYQVPDDVYQSYRAAPGTRHVSIGSQNILPSYRTLFGDLFLGTSNFAGRRRCHFRKGSNCRPPSAKSHLGLRLDELCRKARRSLLSLCAATIGDRGFVGASATSRTCCRRTLGMNLIWSSLRRHIPPAFSRRPPLSS